MKNEKGITLVELLAALAIVGIIVAVIVNVLSTGTTASTKTATKQQLQQEANLIVEVIRSEYLKSDNHTFDITAIEEDGVNKLFIDEEVVSQGYTYIYTPPSIDPKFDTKFHMTIKDVSGQFYIVDTTFSKIR